MKTEPFKEIKIIFDSNQESVRQLINFDRILLDFCIGRIEVLENTLINNQEIRLTNNIFLPTQTIKALKNIRENDSMRPQYESIFNQCVVLAVSHFSSTIHSIFKKAINYACSNCPELLTAINEDIKISFNELKSYDFNLVEGLGDLIIQKKDISFQDMQSSHRTFKNFFNIDCEKDIHTNNIIFAQASRHSIVHASGLADGKFIKQVKEAFPRDIKKEIQIDENLQFKTEEIETIQSSMSIYVNRLINTINKRIEINPTNHNN
jgi:hypothetical protein